MKLLKYHSVWGPNNMGVVFLYSKHGLEIVMVIKKIYCRKFPGRKKTLEICLVPHLFKCMVCLKQCFFGVTYERNWTQGGER